MDDKDKEDEEENAAVADFVRKEVTDWDDDAKSRARFKALSGQRSDWDPLYRFWRDLIIKVARHRRIFIIRPAHVSRFWFRRAGLSPLCLDRVLLEMLRAGDLSPPPLRPSSADTPLLSRIFRRALGLFGSSGDDGDNVALAGDSYIIAPLLEFVQERALEVVGKLSENHWTDSCVITMRKFEDICMGSDEALAILNYLSAQGRATPLIINRADPVEGVKVCLSSGASCVASSADCSVLHLIWTAEKLEQQLDLIDQRYQKSRNCALASLKCGNKKIALRYAKELKLTSQSRERCSSLLDRVEEVLQVITDAESSKKVAEAIKGSTRAMQENKISIEEVELCLQDVDENIDSLKQLDNALESTTSYAEVDDEDIEDEFNKLHLEIGSETNQLPTKTGNAGVAADVSEETDSLSNPLSNSNLKNSAQMGSPAEYRMKSADSKSMSKEGCLEPA